MHERAQRPTEAGGDARQLADRRGIGDVDRVRGDGEAVAGETRSLGSSFFSSKSAMTSSRPTPTGARTRRPFLRCP